MHFQELHFLADENIDPALIHFFRREGYRFESVAEKLPGETDQKILEYAQRKRFVVLTHDSDFGKIIFTRPIDFLGIVYLRHGHIDANIHINTMQKLFVENHELKESFILVANASGTEVAVRLRYM